MKPPYFILNLKPDLNIDDCVDFLNAVTEQGQKRFRSLFVALPLSRLEQMTKAFPDSGIVFGASQMMSAIPDAFTSPLAGSIIRNVGGTFALIGTKEERAVSGATDEQLRFKLDAALKSGLKPIYCVAGSTEEQLKEKLAALENLKSQNPHPLIVYELPFNEFKTYLPSAEELEGYYGKMQKALQDIFKESAAQYAVLAALPADLVGFSALLENMPFAGGFFTKSGTHPHAVHQETVQLFHVHCQEAPEVLPEPEEKPQAKKPARRKKKTDLP
jgi:hypothetical protein